jgi:hypothetical protein
MDDEIAWGMAQGAWGKMVELVHGCMVAWIHEKDAGRVARSAERKKSKESIIKKDRGPQTTDRKKSEKESR